MDNLNDIKRDLPETECPPANKMVLYASLKKGNTFYRVFIDIYKAEYVKGVLIIPYNVDQHETILLNEHNMDGFNKNKKTVIVNCPRLGILEIKCRSEQDANAVIELLKGSSESD